MYCFNLKYQVYYLSFWIVTDCEKIDRVKWSELQFKRNNVLSMYFTENLVGKYSTYFPEEAFNSVLKKKCATEDKLQETVLMINNRE
jgi:hypothetical protein